MFSLIKILKESQKMLGGPNLIISEKVKNSHQVINGFLEKNAKRDIYVILDPFITKFTNVKRFRSY